MFRSPWASIHTTPPRAVDAGHADERAERDRVVAAEDERQGAAADRRLDERGDAVAQVEDLGEVARPVVAHRGLLGHRRLDVAEILDVDPERVLEVTAEPGVADRGRPHVHAAAAGPEVERGADDGDLAGGRLHVHGTQG